jgi:hypothetical protein
VQLATDGANCGACGVICATSEVCSAGRCAASCAAPLAVCTDGASSSCADLSNDPEHCGTCDIACAAGQSCTAGICGPSCSAPLTTCGAGDAARCVDLRSDPQNCGACGSTCSTGNCRAGACSATACEGTIGLPDRPLPPPSTTFDAPIDHALADLDGDGVLDMAVALTSGNLVEIRYVGAFGVFGPPVDLAVADAPEGIAAGDVDGDGLPDLVACSSGGAGAISLLRNRGDGSFERTDFPAGGPARFCALGDLDGDGRPDLVVSYTANARIAVAHNTGGGFAAPVPYDTRPSPTSVALADLDGDGRLDVVVLTSPSFPGANTPELDRGAVSVYPGAGDGTLGAPASYATGHPPRDLVVADLDGDGLLDVATTVIDDRAVAVLRNDGSGALLPRSLLPVGNVPIALAAGDLDGDGTVDLVVNRDFAEVDVLRNDGHAVFAAPEPYAIASDEIALADANGDGALDLYTASFFPHVVLQEAGRLLAATPIPVGGGRVTLADVDGDGIVDAIVGPDELFGFGAQILRGRAGGGFAPPAAGTRFLAFRPIAVGDIDGDGDIDVVYEDNTTIIVQRNRGDGSFGPLEHITVNATDFPEPALADLDGDGDLDLIVASTLGGAGTVKVFWNDGRGNFQAGPRLAISNPAAPVAGKLTGSARADIAVLDMGLDTVSVFQGHADGSFTLFATLPTPVAPISVLIADVTQDGRDDLVIGGMGLDATSAPPIRIYPGLDDGLGPAIDLPTPVVPNDLAVADLDSDGRRDLIAVGGELAFFRALPGGGFAAPVMYGAANGNGVAIRDLTGDLRPDIVVVSDIFFNLFAVLPNRCLAP